jgi:hypothetical protein
MQSAHRLGRGSQLASRVYRGLPRAEQVYELYKELKSIAVIAIKKGMCDDDVLTLLGQHVSPEIETVVVTPMERKKPLVTRSTPSFTKKLYGIWGGRGKELRKGNSCITMAQVLRE